MNVSLLAILNIRCYRCGILYYSTDHLKDTRCRLCKMELIEDSVQMVQYSKLNDAIEIVLPRHLYTLELGPLERLRIRSYPGVPIVESIIWAHTNHRLKHRIQHGSWKSRHRRKRTNLLSRMMSEHLPMHIIRHLFEYITWEEMSVLFRYYMKQLDIKHNHL